MNKIEKIKTITDNLSDFSSADRIQKARLCAAMHSEEFEQCGKNIQVFHIADRIGLFSKTGFSMTGKTREAVKKLELNETTKTYYEITENNQEGRVFIEKEKTSIPTIQDMLDNDWTIDDLYGSRNDSEYFDKDGELLESERETDLDDYIMIKYWDGNNCKTNFVEKLNCNEIEANIKELMDETPNPAYYFVHEIELEDGEKIKVTSSNCSGSISPYFEEYIIENE